MSADEIEVADMLKVVLVTLAVVTGGALCVVGVVLWSALA